ncbi:MAG TPA: hypothetical protein PKJ41_01820 [Bryobacteraceae bacterium]|nr:hypothetical protein [Bryobacteraceae bacterium]HPT25778.1 hypothetical protein [Bryobacteraceae bacterium]
MSSPPSATKAHNDKNQNPTAPANGTEPLVRGAFDDVALLIGSVAVIHQLDDDLTWTLMKRLDRIRIRLLRDLKGVLPREDFEPTTTQPPRVHAAVEEFLARNRAGMGE